MLIFRLDFMLPFIMFNKDSYDVGL